MRDDRARGGGGHCSVRSYLVCAFSAGSGQAQQAPPRPNIVVFLTDDQGYGDLSSFGHPTIKTPNIDRMAPKGPTHIVLRGAVVHAVASAIAHRPLLLPIGSLQPTGPGSPVGCRRTRSRWATR